MWNGRKFEMDGGGKGGAAVRLLRTMLQNFHHSPSIVRLTLPCFGRHPTDVVNPIPTLQYEVTKRVVYEVLKTFMLVSLAGQLQQHTC